ncbi:MAG: hypothetical protein KF796_01955 [Ramlibacter sp.]|nr:hypothetical protein [Ramlibacter sp.]
MKRLAAVLKGLLLAGCGLAQGVGMACTLVAPGGWSLGAYDPGAGPAIAQPMQVRVVGGKGCLASLQVEWPGVAGELPLTGPGGMPLRVSLSTDAGGSAPVAAAPQDAAAVALDGGRESTVYLWARPYAAQWVSPGTYVASLRLRLVDGTGTVDEREVPVSVQVTAAVRAAFAGSAGKVARLDFGELAQGAQRSTQLDVQANTGHRITLESAHGGRLVNRRFVQSAVDYRLRVGGAVISPKASGAGISIPSAGVAHHRIEVEIGTVERVLAGDYADDLLITITAQ